MARGERRHVEGSKSPQASRQDEEIVDLFSNSLGPSQYFVKDDGTSQRVHTGLSDGAKETYVFSGSDRLISDGGQTGGFGGTIVGKSSRKRKRGSTTPVLEDEYLQRLVANSGDGTGSRKSLNMSGDDSWRVPLPGSQGSNSSSSHSSSQITFEDTPSNMAHESQSDLRAELKESQKASRTVFLANVSTSAISSKGDRRILLNHLTSFSTKVENDESAIAIESLRFRSTPYSDSKLPRKAAFVKKALMHSTARSTHAYVVYNSPDAARGAVRHLNGSTVLDRHLRVDSVEDPAQQDHRRCVFVGNLGFVDDDTAINNASGTSDVKRPSTTRASADYEEGLWRTFGQCGTVENVRLVRAQTNQVGKGFAYVQFEDANAVEQALLYDGRKFPPLIPRKLRVSRAKRLSPKAGQMSSASQESRDHGNQARSQAVSSKIIGQTYGRASAARSKRATSRFQKAQVTPTVFEGHRAKQNFTGGKKTKKGKNGRSERAAKFKQHRIRQNQSS